MDQGRGRPMRWMLYGICATLIALKLFGLIGWNWWLVLSPTMLLIAIFVIATGFIASGRVPPSEI